jgi:hypothetical protein
MAWWRVLQARVVQLRHRAGAEAAGRQPSRTPRQSRPAGIVVAGDVSGAAAPHRPLGLPQPVQLRCQRPGAVLQVLQVAVAVERLAVDAAGPAAPIAGLRGARTGVVGLWPAAAAVALVDPRTGREADLPGPTRCPAGHQLSPPSAWLPGSDQPTKQVGTAQSKPHRVHGTPRRWGLPGTVWVQPADRKAQRPAHPLPWRSRSPCGELGSKVGLVRATKQVVDSRPRQAPAGLPRSAHRWRQRRSPGRARARRPRAAARAGHTRRAADRRQRGPGRGPGPPRRRSHAPARDRPRPPRPTAARTSSERAA